MDPLSWTTIAALLVQYGLPFVTGLISNIQNQTPVTPEAWAALKLKIQIPGEVLIPAKPVPLV